MVKKLFPAILFVAIVMIFSCNPGDVCGPGKIIDCARNCIDESEVNNSIGDGTCDENLNCSEFNFDGGDCHNNETTTTTTVEIISTTSIEDTSTTTTTGGGEYLEIDVSGGPAASSYPVTELSSQPTLTDDYKTTKILLREIRSAGQTFTMGSPEDETGRWDNEIQHQVTFTKDYYMGVFEITQRQYELVTDTTPSLQTYGDMYPVQAVSWLTIRGGIWPGVPAGSGQPASDTFIDRLRSKTGLDFDLPTAAQWEYAARATTIRAYNDYTKNGGEGSDCLVPWGGADENLDPLGRYLHNWGSSLHAVVGSYQANLWGLYDTHGNVWEWCLDKYGSYGGDETDPLGPSTGTAPVVRGCGAGSNARQCRSARHGPSDGYQYVYSALGFRLCLPQ